LKIVGGPVGTIKLPFRKINSILCELGERASKASDWQILTGALTQCLLLADTVAKVFLHRPTQIFRAVRAANDGLEATSIGD